MVLIDEEATGCAYTLQPNCAMNWRWTKRLFLGVFCCMAASSVYWVSLGAWLVLPFFGLELLVLGLGLYLSAVAGSTREVVHIDGNQVRILRGRSQLEAVTTLPRHWTRVVLIQDPRGWYLSRLQLRCHGKQVEIASKLVESERLDLADELGGQLGFRDPAARPKVTSLVRDASSPRVAESRARIHTRIIAPNAGLLSSELPGPLSTEDSGFENNNQHFK